MPGDPVGVVGLGRMGLPVAENLLRSGFSVLGHRRGDPAALVSAGGVAAESPADIVADCRVIITCLPSPDAFREVFSGPRGLLAGGPIEGRVFVDLSTLPLVEKEREGAAVAAAGGTMLDCPLSGVPAMAAARKAVVFASGDRTAYEAERAVFDGFTDAHRYLGPFGHGLKMKFIANLLVGVHSLAAAEAMRLGAESGFDPQTIIDVIGPSAGTSKMFDIRAPMMATRTYEPAPGPLGSLSRQLGWIREYAAATGVPTPLLDETLAWFERGVAEGRSEQDQAALCDVLAGADRPGRRRRPPRRRW